MKLRILTKNMQWIQQYNYQENRFNCFWSSQRPLASLEMRVYARLGKNFELEITLA